MRIRSLADDVDRSVLGIRPGAACGFSSAADGSKRRPQRACPARDDLPPAGDLIALPTAMEDPLKFEIAARRGSARLGRLRTAHGEVQTPAFVASSR